MFDTNKINCAIYEINLPWFYLDINKYFYEGKNIKLIEDDKQFNKVYNDFNNEMKLLLDNLKEKGVIKVDNKKQDYMHNKFCIFDKNLSWIGSFNFTVNASKYNNNNVLVLNDFKINSYFQDEFDEMFKGIFNGGNKTLIQNTYPKVYFCPEDDCASKYNELLNKTKYNLRCMFFDFTLSKVGDNIINLKKSNINVKIIMESRQISKYNYYNRFKNAGILLEKDKNPKTMHNKFCVIDNQYVITGSMNPSKHSQFKNDESIILIKNKKIAEKYISYFEKYWFKWKK